MWLTSYRQPEPLTEKKDFLTFDLYEDPTAKEWKEICRQAEDSWTIPIKVSYLLPDDKILAAAATHHRGMIEQIKDRYSEAAFQYVKAVVSSKRKEYYMMFMSPNSDPSAVILEPSTDEHQQFFQTDFYKKILSNYNVVPPEELRLGSPVGERVA
jgi:hypothetical protein